MGVKHVLMQPRHLVGAILALDILGENLDMPPNFPDEGVSCSLKHQTYREVGVVFLLLEASVSEPTFEGKIASRLVA